MLTYAINGAFDHEEVAIYSYPDPDDAMTFANSWQTARFKLMQQGVNDALSSMVSK